MDALGLTNGVAVLRTGDDAGMADALAVQANGIAPVDRQHGTLGLDGICQHRFVSDTLASIAGFGNRAWPKQMTAMTICVGRSCHPQGRVAGQPRMSVIVRPAEVMAGSAVVRLAMGGWPLRRSKITSQPLGRPSPSR